MEVNKVESTKEPGRGRIPFLTRRLYKVIATVFMGGLILVAAVWLLLPRGQQINTDQYQAVYLVNGQMYFGELQNTEGTYLYMKSPYMPQNNTSNSSTDATDAANALIRVKNQLWGPEDSIAIRADQVAFWQNLRDDSKVTQAIEAKQ